MQQQECDMQQQQQQQCDMQQQQLLHSSPRFQPCSFQQPDLLPQALAAVLPADTIPQRHQEAQAWQQLGLQAASRAALLWQQVPGGCHVTDSSYSCPSNVPLPAMCHSLPSSIHRQGQLRQP
jgi:hypothetical protein